MLNGTWEDDHEDYGHPHYNPACLKCLNKRIGLDAERGISLSRDNLKEDLDICTGKLQSVLDEIEELLTDATAARVKHTLRPRFEDRLEQLLEENDG